MGGFFTDNGEIRYIKDYKRMGKIEYMKLVYDLIREAETLEELEERQKELISIVTLGVNLTRLDLEQKSESKMVADGEGINILVKPRQTIDYIDLSIVVGEDKE
jgi:hypothetical protein